MALTIDPATLAANSACYCYADRKQQEAILIYLLAQIAEDTSTPSELAAKAACFCYGDQQTRDSVIVYLLRSIAEHFGG